MQAQITNAQSISTLLAQLNADCLHVILPGLSHTAKKLKGCVLGLMQAGHAAETTITILVVGCLSL